LSAIVCTPHTAGKGTLMLTDVTQCHGANTGRIAHAAGEPGSSVSTVSGYGLDDRAIEVRSPAEAKGFFL
jgi:hypothetical protein